MKNLELSLIISDKMLEFRLINHQLEPRTRVGKFLIDFSVNFSIFFIMNQRILQKSNNKKLTRAIFFPTRVSFFDSSSNTKKNQH